MSNVGIAAAAPEIANNLSRPVVRGYWKSVGHRLRYDYVTLFFLSIILVIALLVG